MGKRIALLFGNNYARYPENALRGCHNDVKNMATELVAAGLFKPREIKKFMDCTPSDQATTRAGMIRALSEASIVTHEADIELVYVHYSGHGTSVRDMNADESDGKDEAIVPSDFEESGLIIDDWLGAWVNSFNPNTRLVVVFDCCFSGSSLDIKKAAGRKVTYLSGCTDTQASEDAQGIDSRFKYTGALTTCLIQTLQSKPELFDDASAMYTHLRALMQRDGFEQIPILTTTHSLDDPVFIPKRSA